jgi:penicillin amidase
MARPVKPLLFIYLLVLSAAALPAAAQPAKQLSVKGLQQKVEVLRDEWGVNHIYAANEHDLFFTQGYCAAKDRLFQFEMWRRQATGTLSEILGARELKRDIGSRLFQYRGNREKELNHYHPHGAAIIQAFTDGVNAYITEARLHPEMLPVEFRLLGIQPGNWTTDIVISRHQGLMSNATDELNTGRAVAKAGVAKVKDIAWYHPKDPDIRLDTAITSELLAANILDIYSAFKREVQFDKKDILHSETTISTATSSQDDQRISAEALREAYATEGSNNWIVSGSRSASGHAMLANDPHRRITVPSLRYMVHLVAPGWNVTGGGEPVIPGVSIGHNSTGAWGLTIFETDAEDLYVYDLKPDDLSRYRYKGQWVAMEERKENFSIKNAPAQTVILRYTVHGPVTYIDTLHKKAYALRCGWLEPGGAPYLASLRIDQATSWDTFREACSYSHMPGENMIWADTKGNTGWQTVGIIPIRKNHSGMVPVPGDGRYDWSGFFPIKERPHLLNPAKGFFATANQHVTPDNYNHWEAVGYTWADPFRGNRINEVLAADSKMTIEKMQALQTDYFSIPARTLIPLLQPLQFSDSMVNTAKKYFTGWDYRLDKNSIPAAIYAMWERQLMLLANKKLVPDEIKGLINLQLSKLIGWLQQPDGRFGADAVAGRDALLKEAFTNAVTELTRKLGASMDNWQYGQEKFRYVELIHPLTGSLPADWKNKLNLGPLPRGGNGHTPGANGGIDNQLSGASFRLIVDTGDWDKAVMINTPGQSGNPDDVWYGNLFERWAEDRYFPAVYSPDAVKKVTREKLLLQPAQQKR